MKQLLNNSDSSDFKIVCEDQTFPCHRIILANHSEVLSEMIKAAEDQVWNITDFKPETVKLMIHFIYCHQLPEGTYLWVPFIYIQSHHNSTSAWPESWAVM